MTRLAAVDAPNLLYHLAEAQAGARLAQGGAGRALVDAVARAALEWVERFEDTGHTALLIREGQAPPAKAPVQRKRRTEKAQAERQARTLVQQAVQEVRRTAPSVSTAEAVARLPSSKRLRVHKALRRATRLTRADQNYILLGLARQGFRVVEAPGEAEAQAAVWQRLACIDVVVSRDFDAFLYGASRVARNFDDPSQVTEAKALYEGIGVEFWKEFLGAHILAGRTDYARRHPEFWYPKQAAQILRQRGGFEAWMQAGGAAAQPWQDAYALFLQPRACYCPPLEACICPAQRTTRLADDLAALHRGKRLSLGNFERSPETSIKKE